MSTIVYKLGGSLLALPDLAGRLGELLKQPLPFPVGPKASRPNEALRQLLVVGGGPTADTVRQWDQLHGLGDCVAHDLALQSMTFNARLVAAILGDARLVSTRAEANAAWASESIAVLAAAEFVAAEERASGDRLPRSWDVTSDSVAAYVALHWPADALVLLKSVPLPAECDVETVVTHGDVDSYFPQLASRLPWIGWANMRSDMRPAIKMFGAH
jgi:aspartokinase-like uncharacterized kinase